MLRKGRCQVLYGGHLASPSTEAENFFLRLKLLDHYAAEENLLQDNPYVWFGAFETPSAGWKYTTGELMNYTDWFPGQPDDDSKREDGDCGLLWANPGVKAYFHWGDYPCGTKSQFICQF